MAEQLAKIPEVSVNTSIKYSIPNILNFSLINYNPEILPISPLVQGKINNYVNRICKKIEIKLIDDDSLGGLAFMQKFKKIDL